MDNKMRPKMKGIEARLIRVDEGQSKEPESWPAILRSQPTITRTRTRLEKEGVIKEYTMIPDFKRLG